ncbi:hypothetical protein AAMO2058_000045000 [Amorphochlora amoebiformis]
MEEEVENEAENAFLEFFSEGAEGTLAPQSGAHGYDEENEAKAKTAVVAEDTQFRRVSAASEFFGEEMEMDSFERKIACKSSDEDLDWSTHSIGVDPGDYFMPGSSFPLTAETPLVRSFHISDRKGIPTPTPTRPLTKNKKAFFLPHRTSFSALPHTPLSTIPSRGGTPRALLVERRPKPPPPPFSPGMERGRGEGKEVSLAVVTVGMMGDDVIRGSSLKLAHCFVEIGILKKSQSSAFEDIVKHHARGNLRSGVSHPLYSISQTSLPGRAEGLMLSAAIILNPTAVKLSKWRLTFEEDVRKAGIVTDSITFSFVLPED